MLGTDCALRCARVVVAHAMVVVALAEVRWVRAADTAHRAVVILRPLLPPRWDDFHRACAVEAGEVTYDEAYGLPSEPELTR